VLGISDDTPFWNYLNWDAWGSGEVRQVGHSPAHLRRSWIDGQDIKRGMDMGRAFHACVLEADTEWPSYYRLPEGVDRRHKEYKEAVEEHGRDYVLRADEYDGCIGGRDRLNAHSRIKRLLASGRPEVSFAWEDGESRLTLKGRADWITDEIRGGAVLDLKRTADARESTFRRVARQFGYPVQGAHYLEGLNQLGMKVGHYAIIACEFDPPWEPVIYRVSEKDIMIALEYWRALVALLAWCVKHNKWPGYPEMVHVLHMGSWWEADMQQNAARIHEALEAL
jgi:hypothetical protein